MWAKKCQWSMQKKIAESLIEIWKRPNEKDWDRKKKERGQEILKCCQVHYFSFL